MFECRIEIVGVPVLIRCQYRENVDFFRDYKTRKQERCAIEPSEADLERIQADLDRMDEEDGIPQYRRNAAFLENNAIHSLLAERLIQENVLLMHGSALCMDGGGIVFIAKSGTGKSTHARLWREVFGPRVWMINDDKPMLRIEETGVTAYGTPWDGKHRLSRNASAPLKAIVILRRGDTNRIAPLSRIEAFPALMKQCLVSRNPETMARIMSLEKRLLDMVDFYSLECNMAPEAAKVAWEGISAGGGFKQAQRH